MPVEIHVAAGKGIACHDLSFAEYLAELWMKGRWSPSLLGQFIWHLQTASAWGAERWMLLSVTVGPHVCLGSRAPVHPKLWSR